MEITGERLIPLPRNIIWDALNDAETLKACIKGCEQLDWTSETSLEAVVSAKIGPVKAKFRGDIELSNIQPLEGYTLSGQGKGGAAGFAKGSADVSLLEQEGGTLLSYTAKASVGGKLAQIGSRLIDSTAKKYADDFFTRFSELAAGKIPEEPIVPETKPEEERPDTEPVAAGPAEPEGTAKGVHPAVWATLLIALVLLSLYFFYA